MEDRKNLDQSEFSEKILKAFSHLANIPANQLKLKTQAIAGVGENSYGLVLQVHVVSAASPTERYILKIAPKNPSRRSHMRVADYYAREVFMYDVVFRAFRNLASSACVDFDYLVPELLHYCLDECDEFIIFEDLTQSNYTVGKRTQLPDYDMTTMALRSLAKLHALSFFLQTKRSDIFNDFVGKLQPDNLFTPDIEPLSIEFGKSYIKRARRMIEDDPITSVGVADCNAHIQALKSAEENFKEICLYCVNGRNCAPYAVICHGDFWNNNILFKYNTNKSVISAKLIDFQMSRYASPILDLVHYLFICTSRDLRESNLKHFLNDIYYSELECNLRLFELDVSNVYPREIFEDQLQSFGIYGLCMAAFSLPFFVADITELPDLDKVSEAICDINSLEASKAQREYELNNEELKESQRKLIEDEFNLLTERTAILFKSRMAGIVADIVKYGIKTDIQNFK